MVQFKATKEQISEWFPETYNSFISELRNSKSTSSDKPDDKIDWYVSWGFFGKKAKDEAEAIQKEIDYEAKLHLIYDERCEADLPKIRISIGMKAGNRTSADRVIEQTIPDFIIEMAYEVIKITMLQEQMIINDPIVQESLAPFQHLLDGILEEMREMGLDMEEGNIKKRVEVPMNMDDILDKINDGGMSSLSAKELKYLEKMSKG